MSDARHAANARALFKKCPNCGFLWETRDSFLEDPEVMIIGYQASFKELTTGLLYFNHACNGTLTIKAREFIDLYNGPVFETRMTGTEECRGYCLHQDRLEACPVECECSFVREIIQFIRSWPKSGSPGAR
jgi:hypothetical protein